MVAVAPVLTCTPWYWQLRVLMPLTRRVRMELDPAALRKTQARMAEVVSTSTNLQFSTVKASSVSVPYVPHRMPLRQSAMSMFLMDQVA